MPPSRKNVLFDFFKEDTYDLSLLQSANFNSIGVAVMPNLPGSFDIVLNVPLTAGCIYRPSGTGGAALGETAEAHERE